MAIACEPTAVDGGGSEEAIRFGLRHPLHRIVKFAMHHNCAAWRSGRSWTLGALDGGHSVIGKVA